MVRRYNVAAILLTATSFLGGITVGLFIAPKSGRENRTWLLGHTSQLTKWMNKQCKTTGLKSRDELRKIRKKLSARLNQNFPDLYEATDPITLSDKEILGV